MGAPESQFILVVVGGAVGINTVTGAADMGHDVGPSVDANLLRLG
jgi:hypothetical protein